MIWIVGNKGMLGTEISELLKDKELMLTDREVDITDIETLRTFSSDKKIDWIVNCSAYTAVDKAEDEPEIAFKINELGVKNIALIATDLGAKVIHISTDYVFDGNSSVPLKETDPTGPAGVYGVSKLAGEKALTSNCRRHFILRTAWLYGKHGNNFVYTMLKLMNIKDSLKVVEDQVGSPTWTYDLASTIKTIIEKDSNEFGTYHFSDEGQTSWFGFAQEIYRLGKLSGIVTKETAVNPCATSEYPTKASRPAFSLLSKDKVKKTFGICVPQWEESLASFFNDTTKMISRIRNWHSGSINDIESAEVMLNAGRYSYVYFMCQQAIEKELKALIEVQEIPPRIHQLVNLSSRANVFVNSEDLALLNLLTYEYMQSRYSGVSEYDKRETEDILKKTKEFLCKLSQKTVLSL